MQLTIIVGPSGLVLRLLLGMSRGPVGDIVVESDDALADRVAIGTDRDPRRCAALARDRDVGTHKYIGEGTY